MAKKTEEWKAPANPKLLSGGNPQIPKGEGDAPVQAYIAALPGWKSAAAKRVDEIVCRQVPNVRKAVKWNSPFYGLDGSSWFLSFHAFTRYLKLAFFNGANLDPVPPVGSKSGNTRYFHIDEGKSWDEEQFADWVKQASRLPGEKM